MIYSALYSLAIARGARRRESEEGEHLFIRQRASERFYRSSADISCIYYISPAIKRNEVLCHNIFLLFLKLIYTSIDWFFIYIS